MRIAAIETRRYRYPLDPPFVAAWDPEPRTYQEATVVIVRSDDGVEGYASGDAVPDRALLDRLLVGRRRVGHRRRARRRRDGRLPPRAQLDRRGRSLGSPRARAGRAGVEAARRDTPSHPRVRVERRARRRGRARPPLCRAPRCRRARSQAAPALERLAGRPPGDRRRCGSRYPTSTSWSTRTRAGACPAT